MLSCTRPWRPWAGAATYTRSSRSARSSRIRPAVFAHRHTRHRPRPSSRSSVAASPWTKPPRASPPSCSSWRRPTLPPSAESVRFDPACAPRVVRPASRAPRFPTSPMRFRTSRIPLRVLVVQDDDGAARLLQAILGSETGITVLGRARHGREALTMVAALNPDVVLMDLNMPVMDGVEATRRLRKLGSTARIVVTTGVNDAAMLQEAREAGADAVVAKPPIRDELLAAIVRA